MLINLRVLEYLAGVCVIFWLIIYGLPIFLRVVLNYCRGPLHLVYHEEIADTYLSQLLEGTQRVAVFLSLFSSSRLLTFIFWHIAPEVVESFFSAVGLSSLTYIFWVLYTLCPAPITLCLMLSYMQFPAGDFVEQWTLVVFFYAAYCWIVKDAIWFVDFLKHFFLGNLKVNCSHLNWWLVLQYVPLFCMFLGKGSAVSGTAQLIIYLFLYSVVTIWEAVILCLASIGFYHTRDLDGVLGVLKNPLEFMTAWIESVTPRNKNWPTPIDFVIPDHLQADIPSRLKCAVCRDMFHIPVMSKITGNNYCESCILNHFKTHGHKDPVHDTNLTRADLVFNKQLYNDVLDWIGQRNIIYTGGDYTNSESDNATKASEAEERA